MPLRIHGLHVYGGWCVQIYSSCGSLCPHGTERRGSIVLAARRNGIFERAQTVSGPCVGRVGRGAAAVFFP
jgi:hypothetical protein